MKPKDCLITSKGLLFIDKKPTQQPRGIAFLIVEGSVRETKIVGDLEDVCIGLIAESALVKARDVDNQIHFVLFYDN